MQKAKHNHSDWVQELEVCKVRRMSEKVQSTKNIAWKIISCLFQFSYVCVCINQPKCNIFPSIPQILLKKYLIYIEWI